MTISLPQLRYPLLWLAAGLVLLAPLVAMRFTAEVNWTGFDFLVAAFLLGGGAAAFELAGRLLRRGRARALAGLGIAALVALIWIDGAVGIF